MTHSLRLINISILLGSLLIQGCTSVRSTLGIDREPPDEFAVLPSEQPLDMPPNFYDLPQPIPGAPRPQEVAAAQAKSAKIFGKKSQKRTKGQEELLKMGAGSQQSNEKVRQIINEEADQELEKKQIPLLKFVGVKKPAGEIIDPKEEAKALEAQGLPQRKNN